jgi:uncharacterized protein (DUF1684 family)
MATTLPGRRNGLFSTRCAVMRLAVALFLAAVAGCGDGKLTRQETAAYIKVIEKWQGQRVEKLREPTGWLSLAGLHWLNEGRNTFGSDSSNAVVFPDGKAPRVVGAFIVAAGGLTVEIEPGVGVRHGEETVTSMTMYHDQDPDHEPTVLEWGSLSWYAVERGGRIGIRLKDSESERLKSFKGVDTYGINPRWRIEGIIERHDPPKTVSITDVLGNESQEPSPGTLVFDVDGMTCRLAAIAEPGDEYLFVVFGDKTNGRGSYGGGRFLAVDAPGEDGRVVIDFNKAYNPPCALTPFATCPLPPQQNQLPIAVEAGEKTYGGGTH